MPYRIGGKGDSVGCKEGYAVLTEAGKVVGCHPTRSDAEDQVAALYANVADAIKADGSSVPPANSSFTVDPKYPTVGVKRPSQGRAGGKTGSGIKSKPAKLPKKRRWGQNADNNASSGAIGTSGTSMGAL